jgi:DNA-binding SARP family transcriptional activator/tetratricopeptide (TPR) repeat protein
MISPRGRVIAVTPAAKDAAAPLKCGSQDRHVEDGLAQRDLGYDAAASAARPVEHIWPGSVWCKVLGPLEVHGPEGMARLGGPHQRAVLGVLALQPNVVVHRESIVDALWGDDPPDTATTMIHSYISQLRRLLPGGSDGTETALVRIGGGYRLCLDDDELDLLVFSRLTAQAARARDAGDPTTAFGLLERALGLWRGDPVAGIDLLRDHPLVTGLRAIRASAVTDYAQAARTQAEQEKAIPHLRSLTARESLNEHAHACLMTALAGGGQQAAALEIFGQIRQRLDDQLGVQPGAELAGAHLRVLRGHETSTVFPADMPATEQVPVSYPTLPLCQLPAAVPDFTGRTAEIGQLAQFLVPDYGAGVPLAVICGLPGIGKTALALRIAHQLRPAFPDGQLWVQLDGASTRPRRAAEVLGELLRALGVPGAAVPDALAERAAMYRSRLADRKVLVVADDAGSAGQVRPLIPGTAGSAVIVTSRLQLAELPAARILPLGLPDHDEALRLLAAVIGGRRVSAELQDAQQLVAACGRLPLAVRIAGARLAGRPTWPVSLISEALSDQQRRLDELAAGGLSVRASLAMSYQALDTRSQQALCFLSLLGPTDVAEWVIAAVLGVPDASDVVNRLTDSSLLTPVGPDATGSPRYRLHDLLRDYAAERLVQEYRGQQDAALARALEAWLQLAHLADAGLPREPYFPPLPDDDPPGNVPGVMTRQLTADPIAWFTAERLNLLTAVEHSCGAGNYRLAARLTARVASYQLIQSRLNDTNRMWRTVAGTAQKAGDSAMAAHAELRLAIALCGHGRHASAAPAIDRCITAFEEHADLHGLAAARYWRADCEGSLGRYQNALRMAKSALELARQLPDRQIEFLTLRLLAITQTNLPGCRDEVIKSCEETLNVVRKLGEPAWELEAMRIVGHIANLSGRHQDAVDMCNQALELHRTLGVTIDKAGWLCVIAEAHHGFGRYQEAVQAYSNALTIYRESFQRRHLALVLLKLGYSYRAMGDYSKAIATTTESLPIFRELQLTHYEQRALQTVETCQRQLESR